MKTYQRLNNLIGWLVFAIATSVYFLTLEPTASWWDCGEYISTAFKLQVGHPPGAPFFQILGRIFSLFAGGDVTQVAFMVNVMSALSSSFTILFLFWTITMLARKMLAPENNFDTAKNIAIMGAGVVGSLAYTFSDSFWFSATEGEVYAMSSFFTALVFWAILKWELVADQKHSMRWLIFLAFMVGISIGVHLLNLLAIPAIAYVYYFKKYKPDFKGIIYTGIISVLILAFIMYGIIPEIVNVFGKVELLFVNEIGLPFNGGTVILFLVILSLIVTGIWYTRSKDAGILPFAISGALFILLILAASTGVGSFIKRLLISGISVFLVYKVLNKKHILNAVILSFAFILIGYSSFLMLVIRANANTPINENAPTDAISLLSYLNREQYGDWPLFYGQYYNSPVVEYADGNPIYAKDIKSGKYVIVDNRKGTVPVYDKRFNSIFPRMWSNSKSSHIRAYENWGKIEGTPIRVTKSDGKTEVVNKPTFSENLRFFFSYQIGHMYLRYFMWNFAGRQNDIEGHGGIEHGNWLSGVKFLDEARLGNLSEYPQHRDNPAHNKFYFLPLILGLAGLIYHINKKREDSFVVGLLFLMTGLAIIVYLNQTPFQPRERDYAYAGSFYAFAIWIGLGVLAIIEGLKRLMKAIPAAGIAVVLSLFVPYIMAQQGWDDHNRAGKYAARDFAFVYLDSCQEDAILFTNGDNDTFPLWYAQEVENHRTDLRVVNFMLASGDWYIHQMMNKVYESEPLPFTLKDYQYSKGSNDIVPVIELNTKGDNIMLGEAIRFISEDKNKRNFGDGQMLSMMPTRKLRIPVDTAAVLASGIIPDEMRHKVVPYIDFTIKKQYLYKNDLMLLDIIATNNWKRPIYFSSPSAISSVLDVDQYCHLEGMVYKFLPVKAENYIKGIGGVSTDACFDVLVNKASWGRLNAPEVVVDRESARNVAIPRQNYMRVAQALLYKGEKEKAILTLDKCMEHFPADKLPLDKYSLPVAEIYYASGATEKGNDITRKIGKIFIDDLKYFNSLSGVFAEQFAQDKQETYAFLSRLMQMANQYKQTDLANELESQLQILLPSM